MAPSPRPRPLAPAPAGRRLGLTLGWVCLTALWPQRAWMWHVLSVVVLAGLTMGLRLPLRRLLKRLAIVWSLTALMALGTLGHPDWPLRAGNLLLKSSLSVWGLSLLFHTLSLPETITGLRWLGLPRLWTETFAFWSRYHEVLGEEWHRLQLARRARTFSGSRPLRFQTLANTLGLLFIRAYERAEKVHRAMQARGYRGIA